MHSPVIRKEYSNTICTTNRSDTGAKNAVSSSEKGCLNWVLNNQWEEIGKKKLWGEDELPKTERVTCRGQEDPERERC